MERLDEIRVRLAGNQRSGAAAAGDLAYAVRAAGLQADGLPADQQGFRDLFGSEPPPEYNVLRDEIAERQGLLGLAKRAFAGRDRADADVWCNPRELQQVHVDGRRRVAISITLLPLFGASGAVEHVALVVQGPDRRDAARERAEAGQAEAEGLAAQRADQERGCGPSWTRCRCR